MAGLPCATKLRLLLNYDPFTGALTWRISPRRGYKPGDIAGSIHAGKGVRNPYRVVVIEGRQYLAQCVIWKMMTGRDPVATVDHADTDGLNNRWLNLREATRAQNGHNRKINKNNKSGIKGVHWDRDHKAWKAAITMNKTVHVLGFFSSVEDAAPVIEAARAKFHGEFARAA